MAAIVAGLILLGVVVLVASGFLLSRPAPRVIGPPPPELAAEAVTIPSASGSSLAGWLIRGEAGRGAVLLLHGVRADRRMMIGRLRFLRANGYTALGIDFQAHGESPGKAISFGYLEARDAAAAAAFLRNAAPGERIGVIGVSLGGAAALLGSEPLPVEALILESVYPDIDAAIANRLARRLGPGGRWLAPLYTLLMPLVLPMRAEDLRPIDHIGDIRAPLLLMAGTADRHTTLAESRALFERAPEPKRFWLVAGAAHVNLAAYAPEEYRRQVLDFLGEHLPRRD
jgi:uncharacterized protein